MNTLKGLIAIFIASFLTACTTQADIQAEAKNINITKKSISRLCQWRGRVATNNDANGKEELKMQAAKLGGNTIVLSTNLRDKKQMEGQAYWCP